MIDIAKKVLRDGAIALATIAAVGAYGNSALADSFSYNTKDGKTATYTIHPSEPNQEMLRKRAGFPKEKSIMFRNSHIGKGKIGYSTIAYVPKGNGIYFVDLKGKWQKAQGIEFAKYNPNYVHKSSLPGEVVSGQKASEAPAQKAPVQPARVEAPKVVEKLVSHIYTDAQKKAAREDNKSYLTADIFENPNWKPYANSDLLADEFSSGLVEGIEKMFYVKPSEKPMRFSVGFTTEGLNGSVDFRLGENFRLGPYVQFRNGVEPTVEKDSKKTLVARELVGPGVHRERVDRENTTTETSLDNMEVGARGEYILKGLPGNPFVSATLGMTEKETLEKKSLSSDVIFTDNFGNVLSTQHASKNLKGNKKKENVLVLGVGAGVQLHDNFGLEATAKFAEGQNVYVTGGFRFNW